MKKNARPNKPSYDKSCNALILIVFLAPASTEEDGCSEVCKPAKGVQEVGNA